MFLIFINELGPNYKKENIYEFIFSPKVDEFGMEHALDKIIALGWEVIDDEEFEGERLVFQFGDTIKNVEDKLYSRDLILDYDKNMSYVKES